MAITLPNMGINLPTPGQDRGTWDAKVNAGFGVVDAHDHTSGKGVPIRAGALAIDGDVAWGGYAITALGKLVFVPVTPPADTTALFVGNDNELYWRTGAGTNVKITNGTSINTSLVGGIVGDYSTVGAELAYVDASKTYTFKDQSTPSKKWARLQSGPVRIVEYNTTESVYVELAAPSALAASYTVTWPTAVPGSTGIMQMSAAGVVSVSNTLAGDITLPSGNDVVLQGNGIMRHGDYKLTVPVVYPDFITASGTGSNNGTKVGAVLSASTVAYFPLRGIDRYRRIKSVQAVLSSAPGSAVTYDFAQTGIVGDSFTTTGDTASSTSTTPTVTLATAMSMESASPTQNAFFWMKVTTPAGTTATVLWFVITYDATGV